ncbi:MAG: leucine-rich repeat domain-containing protein, partial [Candidatus Methanoplasma sp.]|nr:leucine-rich repeat domain-containing protein [Candidatus Methanoplasma sp.]
MSSAVRYGNRTIRRKTYEYQILKRNCLFPQDYYGGGGNSKFPGRLNITVLFAVALFLAAAFFVTSSEQNESDAVSGNAGPLTWDLTGNTLTIGGTGAMPDYSDTNRPPWYNHRSSIANVEIGSDVVSIGVYAFSDCANVTHVDLNNVASISSSAFQNCTGLTSIDLSNVTHLDTMSFISAGLISVDLSNVTYMGSSVLASCSNLTSATLPNIASLPAGTFWQCTSLEFIEIPNSVTSIGVGAFQDSGLVSIVIPDSVVTIASQVFWTPDLTSVTVTVGGTGPVANGIIEKSFKKGASAGNWMLTSFDPYTTPVLTSLTLAGITSVQYDPNGTPGIAGAPGRELHYDDADFLWDAGTSTWMVAFTVSGTVTVVGPASNAGVPVTLGSYTANTDASGDYVITVP